VSAGLAGSWVAQIAHPVASGGATFTDYLTGWGTIALAVATFAAVLVSLRQAGADRRRALADRDRHWLAQARLVLTGTPRTTRKSTGSPRSVMFGFQNGGDQPVIDIHSEAWEASAALTSSQHGPSNGRFCFQAVIGSVGGSQRPTRTTTALSPSTPGGTGGPTPMAANGA
jgi:hypothetical protein